MEKLSGSKHWTSRSVEDFTYRIASDFISQVELHMENFGPTKTELAKRLDRTVGRVSQMFNPSNITVGTAVRLSGANNMKVALVAYEDNDPNNNKGPINSEIFHRCWKHMGSPTNFFELEHLVAPVKYFGYSDEAANGAALKVNSLYVERNASTLTMVN